MRSYWFDEIYNEDGSYHGQSSFVFVNEQPGWFVTTDGSPLDIGNKYKDRFNHYLSDDIPPFVRALGTGYEASVIYPLENKSGVYGIINFEFKDCISPNESWKQEFQLIADGFSVLYQLWQTYLMQSASTDTVISQLSHHSEILPKGEPTALLFSPSNGNSDVKSTIQNILRQYNNHFKLENWESSEEPGDIMKFIHDSAEQAILGVAYLSEPSEDPNKYKYSDNPNLIYEAGLLYGIAEANQSPLKGVILIREKSSKDIFLTYAEKG